MPHDAHEPVGNSWGVGGRGWGQGGSADHACMKLGNGGEQCKGQGRGGAADRACVVMGSFKQQRHSMCKVQILNQKPVAAGRIAVHANRS